MLPDLGGLPELWRAVHGGRGFRLRAVVREARTAAISRAESAVHARRGDILDFKMFSNLSLNLLVDLEASAVAGLADDLERFGWNVDVDPPRDTLVARAGERLEGTVLLDFPDGDGELVVPLPRVPG